MQKRHKDRRQYFDEEVQTTEKYYIPYLEKYLDSFPDTVFEVGCGEGGNLLPFARRGSDVVGLDIEEERIRQAEDFFGQNGQKGLFIACDILSLKGLDRRFRLIMLHDVIEHIMDKKALLLLLKDYLEKDGFVYIGFPAWYMPFGGHQQIARNGFVSHCPFLHLLPYALYSRLLNMLEKDKGIVRELLSVKRTRCTIEMFRKLAEQTGYEIVNEQLYFINPHYEVKFRLRPRKLYGFIGAIPFVRNFFSTSCFYLIRSKK